MKKIELMQIEREQNRENEVEEDIFLRRSFESAKAIDYMLTVQIYMKIKMKF